MDIYNHYNHYNHDNESVFSYKSKDVENIYNCDLDQLIIKMNTCEKCGFKTEDQTKWNDNFRPHVHCPHCGKDFVGKFKLKNHPRVHKEKKIVAEKNL